MYETYITEAAYSDIDEAYNWYEIKRVGLVNLFYISVMDCLKLIGRNPQLFAKLYKEIRRALTKKFPNSVFYRIDETQKYIEIIAVKHQAQNDNWLQYSE